MLSTRNKDDFRVLGCILLTWQNSEFTMQRQENSLQRRVLQILCNNRGGSFLVYELKERSDFTDSRSSQLASITITRLLPALWQRHEWISSPRHHTVNINITWPGKMFPITRHYVKLQINRDEPPTNVMMACTRTSHKPLCLIKLTQSPKLSVWLGVCLSVLKHTFTSVKWQVPENWVHKQA